MALALIGKAIYESVRIDAAERAKDAALKQVADMSAELSQMTARLAQAHADTDAANRVAAATTKELSALRVAQATGDLVDEVNANGAQS